MAKVSLDLRADGEQLPSVCARCGSVADGVQQRTFAWSWLSQWSGIFFVLFYLVCMAVLLFDLSRPWRIALGLGGCLLWTGALLLTTKRVHVPIPLCQVHRKFWMWGQVVRYAALASCLLLLGVLFGLGLDWRISLLACGALLLLLYGVGFGIREQAITRAEIRALNITRDTILLAGVAPAFAREVLASGERRSASKTGQESPASSSRP